MEAARISFHILRQLTRAYLDGGEEPPPVAVLVGELAPVLGGELTLLEPAVKQDLSPLGLAWTVTISE